METDKEIIRLRKVFFKAVLPFLLALFFMAMFSLILIMAAEYGK